MEMLLSSKKYLHFAQKAIRCAAIVFVVLLMVLSYHRVMIGMHAQADSMMSQSMAMPDNNCLTLCLTASAVSWETVVAIIQNTFVKVISVMAFLFALAIVITKVFALLSQRIQSDKVLRLILYVKQHWRLKLFSLWTQLFQQGIIAPKLYV